MVTITLNPTDCIETLLPAIELAMEAGDVCRLGNIHYLGPLELAALLTLAAAGNLWDTCTGKIYHARAGFSLVGIDQQGVSRSLLN